MNFLFSAVQCRLECDSGYVSDLTPVFECTGGRYQPATPNMFFCKPAVAMIISDLGEREILSTGTKCDQMLSSIPNKNMVGHSVNLLDNELILGATTVDKEKSWRFMSLNNPRAGLLTNQWSQTKIVGLQAPRKHATLTFGKSLVYLGGDFNTQSLLQNGRKESGEWTLLKLLKRDTSKDELFDKFASHTCSTKVDSNKFLVIGGSHTDNEGTTSVLPDIFEVDILDKKVQRLGEMNRARTQHACATISKSSFDEDGVKTYSRAVLISGGVSITDDPQTIVDVVELFVLDDAESRDLSNKMQKPRFKHQMIQLGEEFLCLGGQTKEGTTKSIEKFRFSKESSFADFEASWEEHSKSLSSDSTSSLAVTAIPESAVECNKEVCQCGQSRQDRIIGGELVRNLI